MATQEPPHGSLLQRLVGQRWRIWLHLWWQRRLPPARRLELGQRHIFIVPTLTGYAFAGALLLMLLVAINYQNSLAYALTFVLAALGLVSALHVWRNLAGLQLQAVPQQPCFAGDTAHVGVRLLAGQRERFGIALGWPRLGLQACDLAKGESRRLQLPRLARRRGWLVVPRMRVESRYPLGIWVAWSQVELDQQLLVYPAPLDAPLLLAGTGNRADDEPDNGHLASGSGVDDYQGLAAWQAGQSLRRVDWKAWSREQGLWVKEFSRLEGNSVMLDFVRQSGSLEQRLSVLCFHVLRLTDAQQPFTLSLPGTVLGPASGRAHRDACLHALATFGEAGA